MSRRIVANSIPCFFLFDNYLNLLISYFKTINVIFLFQYLKYLEIIFCGKKIYYFFFLKKKYGVLFFFIKLNERL